MPWPGQRTMVPGRTEGASAPRPGPGAAVAEGDRRGEGRERPAPHRSTRARETLDVEEEGDRGPRPGRRAARARARLRLEEHHAGPHHRAEDEDRGEDAPPRRDVAPAVGAEDDGQEEGGPGGAPTRPRSRASRAGLPAPRRVPRRSRRSRRRRPGSRRGRPGWPRSARSGTPDTDEREQNPARRPQLLIRHPPSARRRAPGRPTWVNADRMPEPALPTAPARVFLRRVETRSAPSASGWRIRPSSITSRPTDTGRLKRRGPALPGLNQRTPLRFSASGWCEWPKTTIRSASFAGVERLQPDERPVVEDQHRDASEVERSALRQQARPAAVHVPAHGDDGRELPELLQHVVAADVAGVEDHVRSPQGLDRLRPDEAVHVGDDADRQLRRHSAWPTRTNRPRPAAGASPASAGSSATVEPRLNAPISSPRLIGRRASGGRYSRGRPVYESVKAREIRPTLAAPTRTTATGPKAGSRRRTTTRSLTVKGRGPGARRRVHGNRRPGKYARRDRPSTGE